MKWKLARLSVSMAYLTMSISADYQNVIVTKEHVHLIVNFLTKEYTKKGLNDLAQVSKNETLNVEDVEILFQKIEAKLCKNPLERQTLCKILEDIILRGKVTADYLKTTYDLVDNTQKRPLFSVLDELGLIKRGKGVFATRKLMDAYRITEKFIHIIQFITPKKGMSKVDPHCFAHPLSETDSLDKVDDFPCFYCGRLVVDGAGYVPSDGSTCGKYAHYTCIDENRTNRKQSVTLSDFEDKRHAFEGAF
jgi:hypothetical protein